MQMLSKLMVTMILICNYFIRIFIFAKHLFGLRFDVGGKMFCMYLSFFGIIDIV